MSSATGGYGGGQGGFAGCPVGPGYGQGVGGYGQGAGAFGQGAGAFGQGAGGFGQGAGGFVQGGNMYDQGAGFAQGAGYAGFADGAAFAAAENVFSVNDKQTMQNLNDRLANYLQKVKALEEANTKLEQQIKEFYEKQRPGSTKGEEGKDYSKYYETIKGLQDNIVKATHDNAELVLQIDNARLAADDFKMKYETELALRRTVEADITGLRKVFDDLNASKSDLEAHYESLNEELVSLKKNHETDSKGTQGTTIGDVNVELNAAPGLDLLKEMNDMRQKYEAMAEQNRKDAEENFKKMSDGLKKEIKEGAQTVSTSKGEASELRKTLQALEIELQSLLAQKNSLESNLAETEGRFCMQLAQLQAQIGVVEEQLEQIKNDMQCQTSEYEELLDMKTKLENEIAIYQKLIDEGSSTTGQGKVTTTTGRK